MADKIVIKRTWLELASKVKGLLAGAVVGGVSTAAGFDQVLLWFWNGVCHAGGTPAQMSDTVAGVLGATIGAFVFSYFTPETIPSGSTTAAISTTGQASGSGAAIVESIKTPAKQASDAIRPWPL